MDDNEAISTEKKEEDGFNKVINTFPDGSISVTAMENAEYVNTNDLAKAVPFGTGIEGGECRTGSASTTCTNRKIYYSNPGLWKMSFRANYTHVRQGTDSISYASKPSLWMVGGTPNSPYVRIIRSDETGSLKAKARFSAYLELGQSYGTLTRSVSLIVGNSVAKARGNTYY